MNTRVSECDCSLTELRFRLCRLSRTDKSEPSSSLKWDWDWDWLLGSECLWREDSGAVFTARGERMADSGPRLRPRGCWGVAECLLPL